MYIVHGTSAGSGIQFEHSQKGFLRNFNISDLSHPFLAFFLFLQEFTLTRDIAPVAFGSHIFSDSFYSFNRPSP